MKKTNTPIKNNLLRCVLFISALIMIHLIAYGSLVSTIFAQSASFDIILRPKENDTYIKNEATATVIGAKSGTASTSAGTGTGLPGQPLPSGGVTEIANKLCSEYKVCPTQNNFNPGQVWTMPQMKAIWNVVQKIYQSPMYKNYAIGNNTLEITKAACLPSGCQGYWGYYAGLAPEFSAFHNIPGSRLIIISSQTPSEGPVSLIEWLVAHEIGHGASGGTSTGGLDNCGLACNPPSQKMLACKTQVSTYATPPQEYVAEAISFYMTNAEQVRENYNGPVGGSMKNNFPCLYNATREIFGGVEY